MSRQQIYTCTTDQELQDEQTIERLQNRERKLWSTIKAECGSDMQEVVAELVELQIDLEALSNK